MKFYLSIFYALIFLACNQKKSHTTTQPIPKNVTVFSFDSIANIEANEKNNPPNFLNVKSDFKKSAIGWYVKGSISCITSMSSYRDIVLETFYFTKSHKLLGTSLDTLKESIGPNGNNLFEFNANKFREANTLKIVVLSAYNVY